jgi:hypothetical protein
MELRRAIKQLANNLDETPKMLCGVAEAREKGFYESEL